MKELIWSRIGQKGAIPDWDEILHTHQKRYKKSIKEKIKVLNLMKKLFWSRIDNKEGAILNSDEISHTDQNRYEKPIKNNLKVWKTSL